MTDHGADTVYIGSRGVNRETLGFIAELGIRKLIHTSYPTMHEYVHNGFLLDVHHKSKRNDVSYLRNAFDYFANTKVLPQASPEAFEWYVHAGDITVGQGSPDMLPSGVGAFDELPSDITLQMGLGGDGRPIHIFVWGDPTDDGYWAEICKQIPPPNDAAWPQ